MFYMFIFTALVFLCFIAFLWAVGSNRDNLAAMIMYAGFMPTMVILLGLTVAYGIIEDTPRENLSKYNSCMAMRAEIQRLGGMHVYEEAESLGLGYFPEKAGIDSDELFHWGNTPRDVLRNLKAQILTYGNTCLSLRAAQRKLYCIDMAHSKSAL